MQTKTQPGRFQLILILALYILLGYPARATHIGEIVEMDPEGYHIEAPEDAHGNVYQAAYIGEYLHIGGITVNHRGVVAYSLDEAGRLRWLTTVTCADNWPVYLTFDDGQLTLEMVTEAGDYQRVWLSPYDGAQHIIPAMEVVEDPDTEETPDGGDGQ